MPRQPKKPCSYPGCPELVDGRYCEAHQKESHQTYNRYERDPESNKRYGRQWRRIRQLYLHQNPLCEQCQAEGRLTAGQEVHHILPLGRGGTNDFTNLQTLCKPCHSKQSILDGDRFPKGVEYKY